MGYLHTRRYIIDADTHEDLVDIVYNHLEESDINALLDEHSYEDINDVPDVILTSVIAHAVEVGNLTDVCLELDEWTAPDQNVEVYFDALVKNRTHKE